MVLIITFSIPKCFCELHDFEKTVDPEESVFLILV